jgi:starvation-inducible outer membrane lipoprotein
MTRNARLPLWSGYATIALSMAVSLSVGCSNVPRYYVLKAEPDTTLTTLTAHPENYVGKIVLLGGTILEEEESDEYLLLRIHNRPLDQDYLPHRPPDVNGPEAGYYWLIVGKGQLPATYRKWARMTVAGRVTGSQRLGTEPVLALMYVRGWGMSGKHDGIWKSLDPNYMPSVPGGLGNEQGGVR